MDIDHSINDLLEEDKSQEAIKSELSQMSFADLQKLKEKLGTKVYNETVFNSKKKPKKKRFKQQGKDAPQEESSKHEVSRFRDVISAPKKEIRDPRFDRMCGDFNPAEFKKSYAFLSDLKRQDLELLEKEKEETSDPKTLKKINYLKQRLTNQLREEQLQKEKIELKNKLKEENKKPFVTKAEEKMTTLITQYDKLKESGKLQKHLVRLRKKIETKNRKKIGSIPSKKI